MQITNQEEVVELSHCAPRVGARNSINFHRNFGGGEDGWRRRRPSSFASKSTRSH